MKASAPNAAVDRFGQLKEVLRVREIRLLVALGGFARPHRAPQIARVFVQLLSATIMPA